MTHQELRDALVSHIDYDAKAHKDVIDALAVHAKQFIDIDHEELMDIIEIHAEETDDDHTLILETLDRHIAKWNELKIDTRVR